MKKFECCFELPHKGIYMEVVGNPEFDNVDFSLYSDFQFQGSVCVREKEIDELITYLQQFKERRRSNGL